MFTSEICQIFENICFLQNTSSGCFSINDYVSDKPNFDRNRKIYPIFFSRRLSSHLKPLHSDGELQTEPVKNLFFFHGKLRVAGSRLEVFLPRFFTAGSSLILKTHISSDRLLLLRLQWLTLDLRNSFLFSSLL